MAIDNRIERNRAEQDDNRTLWIVLAIIIVGVLAYAGYSSYYTPQETQVSATTADNSDTIDLDAIDDSSINRITD